MAPAFPEGAQGSRRSWGAGARGVLCLTVGQAMGPCGSLLPFLWPVLWPCSVWALNWPPPQLGGSRMEVIRPRSKIPFLGVGPRSLALVATFFTVAVLHIPLFYPGLLGLEAPACRAVLGP